MVLKTRGARGTGVAPQHESDFRPSSTPARCFRIENRATRRFVWRFGRDPALRALAAPARSGLSAALCDLFLLLGAFLVTGA
jgi:hypothetical protein